MVFNYGVTWMVALVQSGVPRDSTGRTTEIHITLCDPPMSVRLKLISSTEIRPARLSTAVNEHTIKVPLAETERHES